MNFTDFVYMLLGISIIGFFFYVSIEHDKQVKRTKAQCEAAGGVAIIGDRGHFKVCLNPKQTIDFE